MTGREGVWMLIWLFVVGVAVGWASVTVYKHIPPTQAASDRILHCTSYGHTIQDCKELLGLEDNDADDRPGRLFAEEPDAYEEPR